MSSKVLFDPGKLNGFINAFTRATFVEGVDTRSLLTLGQSLRNVDAGAVTFITVPTAGTNDWGQRDPATRRHQGDLPGHHRRPAAAREERTSGDKKETTPAPAPDITELASAPEELSGRSPTAPGSPAWPPARPIGSPPTASASTSVGNYSSTSRQTIVRFAPGLEAEAATLASAIPGAVLESTSGLGSIVEVVLGTEFDGTLTAPAAPGTPVDSGPTRISVEEDAELPADLAVTNATDNPCA